ncbi:MAG TPA: DNA polymerase III subunit gamma/tau, partial [Syntrophales bacterium]|nr:DNA polymerase III subunit gamma/tau [Syntrophales bacterium]
MEYLVLARKWRPQVFEDVVGQDHAVRTLKNSIRFGRIGHAYLFSSPRGIGKTSVARILAKAVNCVRGPSEVPCNECVNCREIRDGVSMDVREIDGASNRGIDEIRELRENIKFAPVSSRYKVYIIDEVHMLTKEAFNALLKTLEEPPAHVLFVFATTENHKIPATILSRCQHFDFRRVSIQQMAGQLRKIAASEEISVSDRALVWIARAGEGSMRDALSIFDQVISYSGSAISDEDVEAILHLQDRRFLVRLMGAVLDRKAGEALKAVQEAYYSGVDMRHFYQLLLEAFMHLLRVKVTGGGESLDLPEDEVKDLVALAEKTARTDLQRRIDALLDEEEGMR